MEILLALIALLLVILISPLGFIFTLIQSVFLWDIHYFKNFCFEIAGSLDQFGNVVMGPLFNEILIKKTSKYLFGHQDEKISSVLGKNQKAATLLYLGKRLVALLDWLDEDHSLKSIDDNIK